MNLIVLESSWGNKMKIKHEEPTKEDIIKVISASIHQAQIHLNIAKKWFDDYIKDKVN